MHKPIATIYNYMLGNPPSKFETAASSLKFNGTKLQNYNISNHQQQDALLEIFYYAGYFKSANLWNDINHLGFQNPEKVFLSIMKAVHCSGGNQDNPQQFNPSMLRKHIFKSKEISQSDATDFLLYLGQHAFNRKQNQERNELTNQDWMEQNQDAYINSAKKLGLITRVSPSCSEYDEALILGAARPTVITRILDYLHNLKNLTIKHETFVLAGQRPLWAEIDGISSKAIKQLKQAHSDSVQIENIELYNATPSDITNEGALYLENLAKKYNIKLNDKTPMIKYADTDTFPQGFSKGRTYPNYSNPQDEILTETTMVHDVLKDLAPDINIGIIDTNRSENGKRPDTATTVQDYANAFVQRIKDGYFGKQTDFTIYSQSNQPYTERQALAAQKEINTKLRDCKLTGISVKVEGVGFGTKHPDIKKIHSELGALINVKYEIALLENNITSQRELKDLAFSTRDNSTITSFIPNYSHLLEEEVSFLGNLQNYLFDTLGSLGLWHSE